MTAQEQRILVIEDNPNWVAKTVQILRLLGYRNVETAEIAAYERTKADLERAKETMSGNTLINYWESQNDKLRNLGIRPLTLESLE